MTSLVADSQSLQEAIRVIRRISPLRWDGMSSAASPEDVSHDPLAVLLLVVRGFF